MANVKMANMKGGAHDKPVNKKIDMVNNMDKQLRTVDSASALAKHSAKRTSVVGTFGYKAVSSWSGIQFDLALCSCGRRLAARCGAAVRWDSMQ